MLISLKILPLLVSILDFVTTATVDSIYYSFRSVIDMLSRYLLRHWLGIHSKSTIRVYPLIAESSY
jgi:Ulp1 family protease